MFLLFVVCCLLFFLGYLLLGNHHFLGVYFRHKLTITINQYQTVTVNDK